MKLGEELKDETWLKFQINENFHKNFYGENWVQVVSVKFSMHLAWLLTYVLTVVVADYMWDTLLSVASCQSMNGYVSLVVASCSSR